MFSTFANPDLPDLFRPPNHGSRQGDFCYNTLVLFVLPVLPCVPFLLVFFSIVVRLGLSAKSRKQKHNNWKPWALQYPYLLFVNFMAVALIATVITLYKRSECPDPDRERT